MKILLACGGTGGHIFPGVALAESFTKRNVEVVMVGTQRGLEKQLLQAKQWRLTMIETPSFADKRGLAKLGSLWSLGGALWGADRLLRRERPHAVLGVGGYSAVPLLMMAGLRRIPAFSVEPNIVPGQANRVLKHFVQKVFVAYPGMERYFGRKTCLTGVPIRESILKQTGKVTPGARHQVLILGGSQGARSINETIRQALPLLREVREKLHFIHPVGAKFDVELYRKAYAENGISAEVFPFLESIGEFYARCDWVIGRSGAGTVAELSALCIPSLLIPYPFAQGGHQEEQARFLESAGGAEVILEGDLTAGGLAQKIRECLSSPEKLKVMAAALKKIAAPNAAEAVVNECLAQL